MATAQAATVTLPWTRYIPHKPTPKQLAFLLLPHREALYGGSAGGGKSDALLMCALQYADTPGYAALLLRRTYVDLSRPGALMDRAFSWLRPYKLVQWRDTEKTWVFPSGAKVTFGYLEAARDVYQYQSAEFQMIAFDELTQFTESQYRYLFSRLRRLAGSNVPLRMRTASNPGGVGHEWVKQRFIVSVNPHRTFIPARLDENPHIDRDDYRRSLAELDPITRAQLLNGDWSARTAGSLFRREWFEVVSDVPAPARRIRYWDMAATESTRVSPDPSWTAGVLLAEHDGVYYVCDVRRARATPANVERLIAQTATIDGDHVPVRMEQEPGSSGKNTADHYRRHVLVGRDYRAMRSTGSKIERAGPLSAAAEAGNIKFLEGPWIGDYLDELEAFPHGAHDDQVDATSGAMIALRMRRAVLGPTQELLLQQRLYRPQDNPLHLDLDNPTYIDTDTGRPA